jgi:SAM-dependent methyltransferase
MQSHVCNEQGFVASRRGGLKTGGRGGAILAGAPCGRPKMRDATDIVGHYSQGGLLERLRAALREDGADPEHPSLDELAPYDHFHGRGLEATVEIADRLELTPERHILDIGSGIGGPARYMAARFGCQVTGIDLTAEFCEVARHLNAVTGLAGQVSVEQGDALAMPFADASFDGAYSMNVAMNIADKAAFYTEIARVLRPGGWLFLSEIALGAGGGPDYPTPWALTAASSFLATPEATVAGLEAAGFTVLACDDRLSENRAYADRAREVVRRGGKPPHRAVQLIHGDIWLQAARNTAAAVADGRTVPIEVYARKG